MNRLAVEHVIRAALALNCEITRDARFDRKNYNYPDLPKGYQISQYDRPIGVNGWLDIVVDDQTTRVHICRVHLEEDTGKLFHVSGDESHIDFNRAGVPLMEIVTAFPPDIRTADQARAYLQKLRAILTYIGVSDGKMEEGSLRCEPNLSVRRCDSVELGTKTEIKNLNSFRAVSRGIEYEIERHIRLARRGERIIQETRGWNESKQETFPQRAKEVEQEYRYFPDPDLVPLQISDKWIADIQRTMPELPDAARDRLMRQYDLPKQDADALTHSRSSAAYFEETVRHCNEAKAVANWMMGDLTRLLKLSNLEIDTCKVTPSMLASMLNLAKAGTISSKMAKGILERMFETGEDPRTIAENEGSQISDETTVEAFISQIIGDNSDVWTALVAGDDKKFGFMVGLAMKASQGRVNPQEANRILRRRLDADRDTS